MSLELYLAFVLASFILIIVPGPTASLIIANALRHGSGAGLKNVAGTQAGLALMLMVAGIGLTSLIFNMARLMGPALAGALIAVADTGGAFAVQAACMFVATLWVAKLPPMPHLHDGAKKDSRESFAHSIVEGWNNVDSADAEEVEEID